MSRIRSRLVESESVNRRMLRQGAVDTSKVETYGIRQVNRWPGSPRLVRPGDIGADAVADMDGRYQDPYAVTVTTGSQSFASTGTLASFAGEVSGPVTAGFALSFPTTALTIVKPGTYRLDLKHEWDSYTGGGTVEVLVNGTTVWGPDSATYGAAFVTTVNLGLLALDDTVTVTVAPTAGTEDGTLVASLVLVEPAAPKVSVARLELFYDGVLVSKVVGETDAAFSTATILLGQPTFSPANATDGYFDDTSLRLESDPTVNLLANPGFEDELDPVTTASAAPVNVGNWRRYRSSAARVDTVVRSGLWAGRVTSGAGSGNNTYLYQDVDLSPGDRFDLTCWVYPVTLGADGGTSQNVDAMFDWDRQAGSVGARAGVRVYSDLVRYDGFGFEGTGPSLPLNEWTEVMLRVFVTAGGAA